MHVLRHPLRPARNPAPVFVAGIAEAGRLFGPAARAVARQHIISDLKQEGWTESDPFPQNPDHYKNIGLW
ncbi:MAG: hypothetical protein D6B26_05960 [Spirochaetaceae bacterium]|nr:MAG: hypothetical protein D6B26_05960 [Spirochaetaceae bacterium]